MSSDVPPDHPTEVHITPGARIDQRYLVRRQESVAVNRTDLEELLAFDMLQQGLMGLGIFMLSGSLWLGIEKLMEQEVFKLTPLISLCITASVFGLALIVVGIVLYIMRRKKIKKIFSETEEVY